MVADLYYYSITGTDSHGPVSSAGIRQLARDGVLHTGSFTCQAGASQWKPFNLDDFAATAARTSALPPPPTSAPAADKPYVPPTPATYSVEPWKDLETAHDSDAASTETWKMVLDILTLLIALGYAVYRMLAAEVPAGKDTAYTIGFHAGTFTVSLLIICLVPFLISLFFKNLARSTVRLLGVICMGIGLAMLQLIGMGHQAAIVAEVQKADQEMKADAKDQIAKNGYYKGDPEKAKDALDKLSSQATGDTELARGTRALVGVMNELYARVKDAEKVGAACNFDVTTVTDTDDITKRCDALQKLRASQGAVIDFLQNFDTHAHEALTQAGVTPSTADAMIEGTHKTGHFPALVVIWQTQKKLCEDHIARFEYLSKSYGSWNVKDGEVVFSDTAGKEKYISMTQALQDDTRQIADAQKELANSPSPTPSQ